MIEIKMVPARLELTPELKDISHDHRYQRQADIAANRIAKVIAQACEDELRKRLNMRAKAIEVEATVFPDNA